jgi:hypothetical protein
MTDERGPSSRARYDAARIDGSPETTAAATL